MNATYTRGTKTSKVTTKGLQAGMIVLTANSINEGHAANTARKTNAILRTVAGTEYVEPNREYGERNRRITVSFTDGTTARRLAPAETWMLAEIVEEAPASPEEAAIVEEAKIVKAGEAGPFPTQNKPTQGKPAAEPARRCVCCGKVKTGKGSYLPGHDAKHARDLVLAVAAGRLTVETALAEIPAEQEKLVAKVAARINALPQR